MPLSEPPVVRAGFPRRRVLRGIGALAALWLAGGLRAARAAVRPVAAFRAETVDGALAALYGTTEIPPGGGIRIGVAELAENGAVVPIKVEVDTPGTREITLVASRNPVPLVARFELGPRTHGFIATRVKLAESCEVLAIARTPEGLSAAGKHVEVTIGGCG